LPPLSQLATAFQDEPASAAELTPVMMPEATTAATVIRAAMTFR
jgi:hypothetical protein